MSLLEKLAGDIAAHGNRSVFGITGSGSTLQLLDELEKCGVDIIRTQFEGAAGIMAGTVGRLSCRAGVAYGIKGPGLANMLPGLAMSHFESFPVVAVTEAYPPGASSGKAHKRMDHSALVREVTKGSRYLTNNGPGFNELAAWAEAEIPAPVLLQLAGEGLSADHSVPSTRSILEDSGNVMALLESSSHPVVIAGTLAIRQNWESKLAALECPVFSTAAAKGVIDELHASAAGVYTGVGLELVPERNILPAADLVIGLGLRPGECLAVNPFPCRSLNIDSVRVPGAEEFEFSATTTSPSNGFWELLSGKSWGIDLVKESLIRIDREVVHGFLPGFVFQTIAEEMDPHIRVAIDTGNFCTVGEHAWRARRADLCLLSGQGRYMGSAIPMALGAAIHDPSTPVVVVAGDGGFGMYVGEIRLAVDRQLPILFVLMTDGRFGSIATRAIEANLSHSGIMIENPSWRSIMDGFGMQTWLAEGPEAMEAAISSWVPGNGPAYLEITFDSVAYEKMCRGIR